MLYSRTDYQNYKLELAAAEIIKRNPEPALAKARANIKRWGWDRYAEGNAPMFVPEVVAFINGSVDEIIRILQAPPTDHYANRIRSNSPFVGLISQDLRRRILKLAREEFKNVVG